MYDAPPGKVQQGQNRVLRGGSWHNNGNNLRSAYRNHNTPDKRNNNIGLRVAGALWAGGSINQRFTPFHLAKNPSGQNPGPRCASRQTAQHLPAGRFYSGAAAP